MEFGIVVPFAVWAVACQSGGCSLEWANGDLETAIWCYSEPIVVDDAVVLVHLPRLGRLLVVLRR